MHPKKQIRVAHIVSENFGHNYSGVTHRLYSLLSGWQDPDITLDLWGTDLKPVNMNSGDLHYQPPEGTVFWTTARRPGRLARAWAAARLLATLVSRQREFDIAHFTGLRWGGLLSPVVLHRLGKKAVLTTCTFGSDNPNAVAAAHRSPMALNLYRQFDGVVAVSPALAEECRQHGIANVLSLPNFLAVRQLAHGRDAAAGEELRRALSVPPDATVLLFVGAAIKGKGIDLLAESFARLAPKYQSLWLILAGPQTKAESPVIDEEFVRAARERIDGAGVTPRAIWTGTVRDKDVLARHYSAADIFVFPTRGEGMPNVLIEATTAGLPAVATNLPGCTDYVVKDGETGLLVPAENVDALTQAVERLVSDHTLRARMGQAARDSAHRFGFDEYCRKLKTFYLEMEGLAP